MTNVNEQFLVGDAADEALNDEGGNGGKGAKFSSLKSGTTYIVKLIGLKDYFQFYSYGIYNQVDSFCADKPSKKTPKGFPIDNLTPWDKAFRYHKDLSQEWTDAHSQEAQKYKPKSRFAMAFFDLTSGEVIAVDLSAKQHTTVKSAIEKYAKRKDKIAFELSKTGESTGTVVSLAPVIDMEEDLDDVQRANFEKAPAEIDMSQFFSAPYIADEKEQIEALVKAGFDISLIGLSLGAQADGGEPKYNF
ncbi:hypothetical protein [Cytobacillus gottheilii]|uniref:Uncharacterized protein n=1 Tax=Cytobacillus gottheilii TaxID=859144 RepID=A0ABX8FG24_9BACI|nr:hypothetical protein [Cytobacillus gottheilii]QVY62953.1 hypothetical protein J1899_07890 [Cytobacillus gottheilii]